MTSNNWAAIEYMQQRGYVSARYIKYVRDVEAAATTKPSDSITSHKKGIWSWLFTIGSWIIGFIIIRKIAIYVLGIIRMLMYST